MKNNKEVLHNKKGRNILIQELMAESFERKTVSFYKYFQCKDPQSFRDLLFLDWAKIKIFGRIYIANEGINAQLSVPEHNWSNFLISLKNYPELKDILPKKAIQEGKSFYKLTIKVRQELVAFGIPEDSYCMNNVGKHLSSYDYNNALENPDAIIVDMRNYYESEIGRFKGAIVPDVEKSKELLPKVKQILKGREQDQVLLYCTGGIRCEKASAYLIKNGFKDVNQLRGGIIQYAHDMKQRKVESKFIGKNFVFDGRLGERVTGDIIAQCHICGDTCDDHTDCKNEVCHILFIQCKACAKDLEGCCSKECKNFLLRPEKERKEFRKNSKRLVSRNFFKKTL
tara:strand:- start:2 stop:1024 length:1023 start_codon:yes stop_codon:yes gene_type:complete